MTGIRVANAPCSFGAFEVTVGIIPNVPGPEEVLEAIAAADYEGIELGPPGYLGRGSTLRDRLARLGLSLAGGYIPIRFSEPARWEEDFAAMAETLDLFEAADADDARPVLADAGSPERLANPGRGGTRPDLGLDAGGWDVLSEGVRRAVELARSRGFAPTFHHHTGSYVEAPSEIERLLELSDVGLLLDTGHLLIGGGDPVRALGDWGDRIDHVHVKDVRRSVLESVIADRADMIETWRRGVFCELGSGDVDLEAFFAELASGGYSGWLVVEQDRIPRSEEAVSEASEAQARNRRWLTTHAGL
ncbi:MAG: TIM barrel protein [Actinomycetota bacterium]|nr:TIM barrel protein [Actinomycetota bacterium]